MALKRYAFLLVALLLSGHAAAQPAPPATVAASLTSTTCPGTGCADLNVSGYASVAVQLAGTWTATVTFRGSVDGTNYQAINCTPTNSSSATTSATANGVWFCSVTGLKFARAVVTAYTSGTVSATLQAAASGGGSGGGGGGGSTPSNTIGAAISTTVVPMGGKDGSGNAQTATFDVSGNMLVAVTGAGSGGTSSADGATYTAGTTAGTPAMLARDDTSPGSLLEDKVGIARGSANRNAYIQLRDGAGNERGANVSASGALSVDGSAVTQPVSAASLPLPTGAATSSAQTTGNSSLSSIDGKTPALVTGRVPVDGSGVTQPVSGTFWQATQPVSGTVSVGNFPTTATTSSVSVRCVDVTGSSFEACGGSGGGGSNAAASATGSAVPSSAGYTGVNVGGTLRGWTGLALGSTYSATAALVDANGTQTGTTASPIFTGTQLTFGTKTTLTTTNYTSLASNAAANCTTGCWQSASITTGGAKDLLLRIQSKGQAGSTSYADVYVCSSMSSDSTFSGGCSGSEGSYTVANVPNNMRFLGSLLYNGTTAIQAFFDLSDIFATLPGKVAFVIKNQSGGTLSTTAGDHIFDYQLVN